MTNGALRWGFRHYSFRWKRGSIRRRVFKRLAGIVLDRDNRGNLLLLDLGNYVDATIYLEGSFEGAGIAFIENWIRRNGATLFIDIGANIGAYSVCLAPLKCVHMIHAFEPDPRNRRQLLANLFLSPFGDKVHVHHEALSDSSGEASFFTARRPSPMDANKMNTGTSSLTFSEERHHYSDVIVVQKKRLDDVLDVRGAVVAVKVDVEGHEAAVLRGATRFLSGNTCLVLAEVFGSNVALVEEALAEVGYVSAGEVGMADYRAYVKATDRLSRPVG